MAPPPPHTSALEQELALDLVEIGPVGLIGDERIDLRLSDLDAGLAVGGDGAGIARGQRLVGLGIAVEQGLGLVEKAEQLGLHHVVAKLQLRRVDRVVIGARHDELAQLHQALLRQRVGLQEWIDAGDAHHLAGQGLEGFEHAARGLLGCVEEFDAAWSAEDSSSC